MTLREKAYLIADRAHNNQMYGIFPYTYHLHQVAKIAGDLGCSEQVIISCILHDILEDTNYSYSDIKAVFGKEIAEIVYCVTDELGRNRKERKEKTYPKIKGNWEAVVVKICDRIANIQHSLKYNDSKLKMYKKEHEEFCKELMSSSHPQLMVNRAWDKLNKLI